MEYKGYKGIALQNDTIKKWLYTRKRSHDEFLNIGHFQFPGIYTTQNFKSDAVFFWIALVSELGFLFTVSVMIGGFDVLLSLSALVCVILDFIGAFFYHKNENEICKAQLDLNIDRYKIASRQAESDSARIMLARLNFLKKDVYRRLGVALIIISALLKISGSAVLFEMPVFTIVLTVIYCFVAWIHIKKTGFYISGRQFLRALDKELKIYIINGSNDSVKTLDRENDFRVTELENIPPEVLDNLKEIRMQIFENTSIYNSLYKKENKWYYRMWDHQTFDDADLQLFINSKDQHNDVLPDAAKAFIAADVSKRMFLSIRDKF